MAERCCSQPPSKEDIGKAIKVALTSVESLDLEHTAATALLNKPEFAKRYLGTEVLMQSTVAFAYKGNKRYCRITRPPVVDRLVPEVEPDFSVIPGGAERLQALGENNGAASITSANRQPRAQLLPLFEFAFDGQKITRNTNGSIVSVHLGTEKAAGFAEACASQFLEYAGIELSNPFGMPKAATGALILESVPTFIAREECQTERVLESFDGRPCVVLKKSGEETLWLDPQMNYAVRKREVLYVGSGLLRARLRNSDFVQISPGLWLPRNCDLDYCAPPGAPEGIKGIPLLRSSLRVRRLSVNDVPDSRFVIHVNPGTLVADSTVERLSHGKPVTTLVYSLPADQNELDRVIEENLANVRYARTQLFWRTVLWYCLYSVAGIGGICVLLLGLRKIRQAWGNR